MENFKKFYLDFVFMNGTIWFLATIYMISNFGSVDRQGIIVIAGVSLIYAITHFFWDKNQSEKIKALEQEIKRLKEAN